ncbi:energy-coupling factor ABC transporter ATP-binding protein [Variovorax sp. HJSM1_2]|uniref:energy-coupling factor ABC transporter ATP-binding protein n=1 Tax=Variovorax sp. HJSM1_2 TaxID=3366263 RepID=UPI003BBD79C3
MSIASPLPPHSSLALHGVTLRKGASLIFEQLSLQLSERRIGLIGDNGAGKSSLMRLLCGLDQPQAGSVLLDGQALGAGGQRPMPGQARAVGMMFQNPDDQIVFPTVAEELALSLSAQGLGRTEARSRVLGFLAERGLSAWADRAISSLSQGQRQQVCWLALGIAGHNVLLLDEPYASLDLPGQALLRSQIAASTAQVLLSTHALEHVRSFERVIWLERGRVRLDGPGADVCAAYEADVVMRIAGAGLSAWASGLGGAHESPA